MNLSQTKNRHRGFTLIELLFVIAIIAVLSTMALGVMRGAQNDAKEAATLARISQIEAILQVELEDYEVRRLPIALNTLAEYVRANPLYTDGSGRAINVGVQVRNLKRRILQDIINAEIPRPQVGPRDANGNLTFQFNKGLGKFPTTLKSGTGTIGFEQWLKSKYGDPGLSGVLKGVPSSRVRAWKNFRATLSNDEKASNYHLLFNLPGEYLYQTLASIDFDGAPAIELLGNQAIGNSDDDAFPEVVDAWGDPLQLRIWQVSAVEVAAASGSANPVNPGVTDVWKDNPSINFDIRDGDGVPQGYSVIDPTIPRDTTKIRFEVISTRLVY